MHEATVYALTGGSLSSPTDCSLGVTLQWILKVRCMLQIYTLNKDGLICDHKQIWTNMTALQGIKLALTPCKRPE